MGGQKIKTEMAALANVKVFRTYTETAEFHPQSITKLAEVVKEWQDGGCENMELVSIYLDSKRNSNRSPSNRSLRNRSLSNGSVSNRSPSNRSLSNRSLGKRSLI